MIEPHRLRAGLWVRLPSGHQVILRRLADGAWECDYVERVRGSVEFSPAWLAKHCSLC